MGRQVEFVVNGLTGVAVFVTALVAVQFHMHVAEEISCQTVVDYLEPCETYLQEGGSVSEDCCNGVKSLNEIAQTNAEKQTVCECLKSAAEAYSVNQTYASQLPSKCDVTIAYNISYNTNCSDV